jgi:outer membrane protein assembly factor BamB
MIRSRILIGLGAVLLCGCQSMPSWMTSFPSIPPPSLSWLGIGRSAHKPGPLPSYDAKVTPLVNWQVALGAKGGESFAPAIRPEAIYAASPDGTIVSVDPASGRQIWEYQRSNTPPPGRMPITVWGMPSRRTERPITCGSEPNCDSEAAPKPEETV